MFVIEWFYPFCGLQGKIINFWSFCFKMNVYYLSNILVVACIKYCKLLLLYTQLIFSKMTFLFFGLVILNFKSKWNIKKKKQVLFKIDYGQSIVNILEKLNLAQDYILFLKLKIVAFIQFII